MGNSGLNAAGRAKRDEFYSRLLDVEKELILYQSHFRDSIVFCNCNDRFESAFCQYFLRNFHRLGLKAVLATSFACHQLTWSDFTAGKKAKCETPETAYLLKVTNVPGDISPKALDVGELVKLPGNELSELNGGGDYRSKECIDLLEEADIVVTNPPFSLFREYVALLMDQRKKFLIIGNQNAITYKSIFHFLMRNQMWLGSTAPKEFIVPQRLNDRKNTYTREDGVTLAKFGNVRWFTNLDYEQRHERLVLVNRYSPEKYPTYDNYDAIEVAKTKNIPRDYTGIMGVPISFLDSYNPDQFEILDMGHRGAGSYKYRTKIYTIEDAHNFSDLNATTVYRDSQGHYKNTYFRILIRNKQPL